ncbi:hypothetical protein D3C75_707670 [compost metagenome]
MIQTQQLIQGGAFGKRTFRTQHMRRPRIHQNNPAGLIGGNYTVTHIRQDGGQLLLLLLILG